MKKSLLIICALFSFAACSKKENLPSKSQLDTTTPPMNEFDRWVTDNLTNTYNIAVRYRWNEWNLSDLGKYNFPTTAEHAEVLMRIIKRSWIDSYVETVGEDFIKHNSPRQLTLFGGVDLTPNGTPGAWGQASGGVNVLLFQVNDLSQNDLGNTSSLRAYSGLIHHEFTHILNQNVPFDEENFQKITPEGYTAQWQQVPEEVSHQEGFISSYARMNIMEDFAEMVKNIVTHSPQEWEDMVSEEVNKYTKQRDDFIISLSDIPAQRAEYKKQIPGLIADIKALVPLLDVYEDDLTNADPTIANNYLNYVCYPFINLAFSDFFLVVQRFDGSLYKHFNSLFTTNLFKSPAQLRELMEFSLNVLIPAFEQSLEGPINLNRLSEISANLEVASAGKQKLKEKEQFVADYFKNSLKIDIYALQANTFKNLSTPIVPESQSDATASAKNHDIKLRLLDSRLHTCSWEKQTH
ncbi:substrate import-associated zinc metallohydrolase lipoprotein [bacterium A37T11]|nr:substrate import-associated zinc metallohydrolase lipoprotein [bacterium A37T11]